MPDSACRKGRLTGGGAHLGACECPARGRLQGTSSTSRRRHHAAAGPRGRRAQQGRARHRRDDHHPRPGPRRGRREGAGLRGLPHRPALPRGRDQRRVPVPARPRGRGIVEAVGEGVTDVAPGDFVILNWRAVDGTCRACRRGQPWYCFSTHNARAEDDLGVGPGAVRRPRHRRVRREDAGARRAVHEGRPGGEARGRGAARLRRDGGHRRGHQHRQGSGAATRSRSSAAAASATRAIAGARLAGRGDRSSRSTSTTGSWRGPRSSAPRTRSTPASATSSRPSRS